MKDKEFLGKGSVLKLIIKLSYLKIITNSGSEFGSKWNDLSDKLFLSLYFLCEMTS